MSGPDGSHSGLAPSKRKRPVGRSLKDGIAESRQQIQLSGRDHCSGTSPRGMAGEERRAQPQEHLFHAAAGLGAGFERGPSVLRDLRGLHFPLIAQIGLIHHQNERQRTQYLRGCAAAAPLLFRASRRGSRPRPECSRMRREDAIP